jgi:hypothetical protein
VRRHSKDLRCGHEVCDGGVSTKKCDIERPFAIELGRPKHYDHQTNQKHDEMHQYTRSVLELCGHVVQDQWVSIWQSQASLSVFIFASHSGRLRSGQGQMVCNGGNAQSDSRVRLSSHLIVW